MWTIYRFWPDRTREAAATPRERVRAFASDYVRRHGGVSAWVEATAATSDDAIEAWFKLPELPDESESAWRDALAAQALRAERVRGRN